MGAKSIIIYLCVEVEDEAGALGELRIDVEITVHLQGHLLADR